MRISHAASLLRAIALTAFVATASAAALAQLRNKPPASVSGAVKPTDAQHSPAGRWRFSTTEMPTHCAMSGEMTVVRAANAYTCKLIVFQTCTTGEIKRIRTSQSCGVSEQQGKLRFTSRLDRIDSVDPPDIMEAVRTRYAPDNFLVQMNAKGDQMDGMFISLNEAPVTFLRVEDPIS